MFTNASYLLGGDLIASLFRLITIALTARALGVESFGILVLLQTYIAIADRIVNFQSWQALIKFGAEYQSKDERGPLADLFKLGLVVDLTTAVLGAIAAASLASAVGGWLQWDQAVIAMAVFYSMVIAFNIEGTCIAVLRLGNRFGLLGAQKVAVAAAKFLATVAAFLATDSLIVFAVIAAGSQILGYVILLVMTFWQLKMRKLRPIRSGSAKRALRKNQGVFTYIVSTNLHSTFRMIPDQLDFLIVAAVLGNAATGMYKVAKELARILTRLVQPLYQSVFPELALLSARGDRRKMFQLARRSAVIAGFAGLLFWLALIGVGKFALTMLFGPQYIDAYLVMIWYALGAVLSAAAFPVTPLILAAGLPRLSLAAIVLATTLYLACLPFLMWRYELAGAGMANVILYLSWLVFVGIGGMLLHKKVSPTTGH